jgi:hypothetical protein
MQAKQFTAHPNKTTIQFINIFLSLGLVDICSVNKININLKI